MIRSPLQLLKRSKARLLPMAKKRQRRLAVHRIQIRLQNGCIRIRRPPRVDRRRQSDRLTAVEVPSREQKIQEKKVKWSDDPYQEGRSGKDHPGGSALSILQLRRASHIFLMKTPGTLACGSKHTPAS